MSEGMRVDVRQTVPLGEITQPAGHAVRIHGAPIITGEHIPGVLPAVAVLCQHRGGERTVSRTEKAPSAATLEAAGVEKSGGTVSYFDFTSGGTLKTRNPPTACITDD